MNYVNLVFDNGNSLTRFPVAAKMLPSAASTGGRPESNGMSSSPSNVRAIPLTVRLTLNKPRVRGLSHEFVTTEPETNLVRHKANGQCRSLTRSVALGGTRVTLGRQLALTVGLVLSLVPSAGAQERGLAEVGLDDHLRDRGPGVATSMFGTYVRKGEWLFYPFFEYYRDSDLEYSPTEFGVSGNQDYRARYRAREALFFVSYGLSEDLAVEFEVATISATFDTSGEDTSAVPRRLEEQGLGDIEGQVRWRWQREADRKPELFSYTEVVVPHHRDRPLIGTAGWEIKVGTGVTRGFGWGTLTARAAVEYDTSSTSEFDLGEYAVEYLKRLSPKWRAYIGVEGNTDEVELITEAQWHLSPHVFVRLNSGVGLTSKATDWAPEVGIVFALPTARTPGRP